MVKYIKKKPITRVIISPIELKRKEIRSTFPLTAFFNPLSNRLIIHA